MFVNYCDLCGQPLKNNDYYSLYITKPGDEVPEQKDYNNLQDYNKAYINYLSYLSKEVKEVCPNCKYIFDKIFEYRLSRMTDLTKECSDLFNLPPKKDNKNDNEKKE